MGLVLDDWQKEILETRGNILLCSGRQVGKSTIIAKKAADFAANHYNKSVLIISSTERQAEELFIKTLYYIEDTHKKLIAKGKNRPTKHVIKLNNKSIIRCLPTGMAGTGIRGYTIDMLIEDEAAFIDERVQSAVKPMLLTTGGDLILVSTPHGRQGFFWDCYNSKDFTVFHVKSEDVIKNRPASESWSELQRTKALEHLEREKRSMSTLEYAQEYLGEFIDELRQFFPDELINKCMTLKRTGQINLLKTYYLGVDIARLGDDESTFQIVHKTSDKRLIHIESIVTRKTLTTETEQRILDLEKLYHFKEIYIDAGSGSLGVGVFDHLLLDSSTKNKVVAINNRARPYDRDEKSKAKLLKEDLYNNLLSIMERGEIQILDDDEIFQSFKSVQYEYVKIANLKTRLRIFGAYTHIVEGLIRAAWCVKDKRLNIWVR